MKIVHFFSDDKFPEMAYKSFEKVYPGQNQFVTFTDKKGLVHNKRFPSQKYPRYWLLFPMLIRRVLKADVVVFHGLSNDALLALKALPEIAKTIWLGWGYDYYDLLSIQLIKPKTLAIATRDAASSGIKQKLKCAARCLIYGRINKLKLVQKINVFSPVLYEDYSLVHAAIPEFKPKYSPWNYGTLEDDHIRGFEGKLLTGDNVLLGNSASTPNNHFDSFQLLGHIDLQQRKVICPLSYGDNAYRDLVIKAGRADLGAVFEPLTDFMPIDEYIAVLQSCSIVIMNHLRQQALGNIVIALYLGAKVFLDSKSPVYAFFIRHGAHVFKLEDLVSEYQSRLSAQEVEKNRQILRNNWSRVVILAETKSLVELALAC